MKERKKGTKDNAHHLHERCDLWMARVSHHTENMANDIKTIATDSYWPKMNWPSELLQEFIAFLLITFTVVSQ